MDQLQLVMKALSSSIRREILWRVWDRELPVAALVARFDVTAPTISGHLAVLREAGLVTMRPEGTTRWYRANRQAVTQLRDLLPVGALKWEASDDFPEQALATATTATVVIVRTHAPCTTEQAFHAFTDAGTYSRWLGVPVSLEGGHFACTMEWGTRVRGTYEAVAPPTLIVMAWDFEDDTLPIPGGTHRADLFITPSADGCDIELHQFVDDMEQARYMDRAWRLVLGRFRAGVLAALDPARAAEPRAKRPRRPRPQSP